MKNVRTLPFYEMTGSFDEQCKNTVISGSTLIHHVLCILASINTEYRRTLSLNILKI